MAWKLRDWWAKVTGRAARKRRRAVGVVAGVAETPRRVAAEAESIAAVGPTAKTEQASAPGAEADALVAGELRAELQQAHAERAINEIIGGFTEERWIEGEGEAAPRDPGLVISKIQQISKLPTLSGVAHRFRSLSIADIQNATEIADLINADPTLTSQVLKVSRSAYYGIKNDDLDIQSCILLIGTERIQMIASLLSGQSFLEQWDLKFKWRLLWMHSYATALLAPRLLDYFGLAPSPSLYTGALLHDIGKIILSYLYPSCYRTVLLNARQSELGLREIERDQFGVDHEEAGGVFARLNHFPEDVQAIIRYHSEPEKAEQHQVAVAVVRLANLAAQRFNLGFSGSMAGIQYDLTQLPAWQLLVGASPRDLSYVHETQFEAYLEGQAETIRKEVQGAFQ